MLTTFFRQWRERGIEGQKAFAILTAEISKATFGMTPTEYKKFKNLPKKSKTNLRDHTLKNRRFLVYQKNQGVFSV